MMKAVQTRTRVKICGIASLDEARLAIAAGADAIGFNGARPPGRRTISDDMIAAISAAIPAAIAKVLLTTEKTADAIAAQIEATRTNSVQILHHISPDESARLAAALPHIHRVQVIHIEGPDAIAMIPVYAAHVDAFLLDSGRPDAATQELGGTGRIHDWSISAQFVRQSPRPTFLAGGLGADNVASAMRTVRPFGLDLCSGVRTGDRLDVRKLKAFMTAVRQADKETIATASLP